MLRGSARFEICGRGVGEGEPVLLVAELSANHGGSRDTALRTIEAAKKAGADAIKLQTYTPDTLTLRSGAAPFVVRTANAWAGRTLHDLYAEAMTPWEWHPDLAACAEALGLVFFSTPFDPTACEYLASIGVGAYKIASFELVDLPLVDHVARRGKPLIVSTGMATQAEIEAAIRTCLAAGNRDVCVLKCVSSYPARSETMNLRALGALASLGVMVGLSDHTQDDVVAVTSVALGAKVIEKHFILDRSLGGPDAFFSLEPDEFARMAASVRSAELALGEARLGPSPDEAASLSFRRSLFVAADLSEGEVMTCDHIRSVRPSNGLSPAHLHEILGKRARRSAPMGTPVTWDLVGPEAGAPRVLTAPVTMADSDLLLAWRNDPTTRRMSTDTAPVERGPHDAWLDRSLRSGERVLEIARDPSGTPVGMVRLDRVEGSPDAREVGLSVAPGARGKGFSHALLARAAELGREAGAVMLVARIREENTPSLRAFKRAGFTAFVSRAERGGRFFFCEKRLSGYP